MVDGRTDRQTDQESVQVQEYGLQIHTGQQLLPSGLLISSLCSSSRKQHRRNTSERHIWSFMEVHAGKHRWPMLMQTLLLVELQTAAY